MGEVSRPDDRDALAPRPPGEPGNVTVLAARPGEARVDMQVGVKHPASLAAFSVVVGTVLGIWLSRVCALLLVLPPPPLPGGRAGRPGPLRRDPPRADAGPGDRSGPAGAWSGHLHCAALRCCPACCRAAGVLGASLLCAGSSDRSVTPARGRCAGLPRRAASTGCPARARPAPGRPGPGRPSRDRPGLADRHGTAQALAGRHGTDRPWLAGPGWPALVGRPWL